jgi:hypothetical protein
MYSTLWLKSRSPTFLKEDLDIFYIFEPKSDEASG